MTVKPLGLTAFRFEKSRTRRPESKNLLPVRSGRNLIALAWRVNPYSKEKAMNRDKALVAIPKLPISGP
jgi:hypothetical protein